NAIGRRVGLFEEARGSGPPAQPIGRSVLESGLLLLPFGLIARKGQVQRVTFQRKEIGTVQPTIFLKARPSDDRQVLAGLDVPKHGDVPNRLRGGRFESPAAWTLENAVAQRGAGGSVEHERADVLSGSILGRKSERA